MKIHYLLLFIILATSAAALDVGYTITMYAADVNGTSTTDSQTISEECDDDTCAYAIPSFTPAEGFTPVNYTLSFTSSDEYTVYFGSTKTTFTQLSDDSIVVKIIPPALVCNENECDKECVVCSDKACHEPGFACTEQLTIEKITPNATDLGITQINLLIRNTGTVGLKDLSAEITGDGITTLESTPLERLSAGEKDYLFIKINASKSGNIDLVIKISREGALKDKLVGQIVVKKAQEQPKEDFNTTEITNRLTAVRESYRQLEVDFQNKKVEGYSVDFLEDTVRNINEYIDSTQGYILEGDYKRALITVQLAEENLKDVTQQLVGVKKQEETLGDKIRSNLIYIGSIAAAIVSVLTAYGLIKTHVERDKEKIARLKEKLGEKLKKEKKKRKKKKKVEPVTEGS